MLHYNMQNKWISKRKKKDPTKPNPGSAIDTTYGLAKASDGERGGKDKREFGGRGWAVVVTTY